MSDKVESKRVELDEELLADVDGGFLSAGDLVKGVKTAADWYVKKQKSMMKSSGGKGSALGEIIETASEVLESTDLKGAKDLASAITGSSKIKK